MTEPFHNICPQCLVALSHLRGGLMAMCALLWISINKLDRGQLGEGERIPVGKPNGSHAIRFCSRSAAAVCREVCNSPCREASLQSCGASRAHASTTLADLFKKASHLEPHQRLGWCGLLPIRGARHRYRRSELLTRDEARRIAAIFAKLTEC
jgi:hypothetical protein